MQSLVDHPPPSPHARMAMHDCATSSQEHQNMYQHSFQHLAHQQHANNSAAPGGAYASASMAIPFSTPPGPAPGSMGFGFGLSAANALNLPPAGMGWGAAVGARPSTPRSSAVAAAGAAPAVMHTGQTTFGTLSSPAASPLSHSHTSRRRRRSSASSDEDGAVERPAVADRAKVRGVKKARVAASNDERVAALNKEVDLGKALASLSKDNLLGLLNNLLTTQPHLRPTIQALLPPPTLNDTLATISTLERAVVAAIPSGAVLREEYIWGRVRVPLEEYVSESKTFLSAFISAAQPSSSDDEIGHPSTTFAFLHALTSSIRRLEATLPAGPQTASFGFPHAAAAGGVSNSGMNPLASHLLPLTLNCWHIFLTRLSTSVNQEGRIISAGMLRGWFAKLDELTVDSPGAGRGGHRPEGVAKRACEGVRERMRKEVGWLVGMRDVSRESSTLMDEEDEL